MQHMQPLWRWSPVTESGELFLVPDPNFFYLRSGRVLLGFSKLEAWRAHIVRTPAAVLTSAVARLPLLFE